ncbi:hypothetical protein [Microlunatus sp. GCM10028923]|uniref:hypothetical protein n=1 Tax=Microlunatus sp. GCM10028923 TaxID=3273400 RepID=UPI00361F7853
MIMGIGRASLRRLLASGDSQVRLNAAVRLAYLGFSDGVSELVRGLSHPEAAIRLVQVPEALGLLGDLGISRARALVSEPGPARLGAARTLARAGEPAGVGAAIIGALSDPDPVTRDDAACLAGELGQAVADVYGALAESEEPHALTASVAVGGARALGAVTRSLASASDPVRPLRALAGLGAVARASRPAVAAVLRDSAATLRARLTAAYTLIRIDDDGDAVADVLLGELTDADRWLRIGLIRAFAQLSPHYPRLPERSVMWPEWEERLTFSALTATVSTRAEAVVAKITEQLRDDDSEIRRNAALALAFHGRPVHGAEIEPGLVHEVATLVTRAPRVASDPTRWPWGLHMVRPEIDLDEIASACERQWSAADGGDLDYALDVPKWQFLHYLVERHGLLLHGSQVPGIDVLEPRSRSWGGGHVSGQPGVFAVDHALFAMYFGIIDKARVPNLSNEISWERRPDGRLERCFVLSANGVALADRPFCDATIYVLPPDTFRRRGELTSVVPVRPLARIAINPADFPLLDRLWGSDLGPLAHQFGDRYPFLRDVGAWPTKTLDG